MALDKEALRKKKEERGRKDSIYYDLDIGRHVLRVLPRSLAYFDKAKGDVDFAFEYFIHFNLFDVDGYRKIICKQTVGQKCPICDYIASLDDKTKVKSLRVSRSYLYNIFDYDTEQIKVLETGPFIYDEILTYAADPDWGELFSLKEGRDIIIEKVTLPPNAKVKNPYTVKMTPNTSNVQEALPEKWDEIIDSLKDRVPAVHDDAFYLGAVEHLRKGTSPEPLKKKEEAKNGTSAPKEEKKKEEPAGDKPACYGLEYSPRLEKCKGCTVKVTCRDATLKL